MYWWHLYEDKRNEEWETEHSSLGQKNAYAKYYRCRKYVCMDISQKTWCDIPQGCGIFEIPKGTEWHFIGRVDTTGWAGSNPDYYFRDFENREFVGFSTISNKNISRYMKTGAFFIYNIMPDDIAHIFPMDSDTKKHVEVESELSGLPSLWLTLDELEAIKNKIGCYDQITCRTKRNGKIIKPVAVVAYDNVSEEIEEIAYAFGVPILLTHPDENVINFSGDMLRQRYMLTRASKVFKKPYDINVECMEYFD